MAHVLVYESDVFDFLDRLPDESLDGVLTDLPYPTTERHRAKGTTTRTAESAGSSNPWYGVLTVVQLCDVLALLYRKLKPSTYLFAYVDDATAKLLAWHLDMLEDLDALSQPGVSTSRAPRDRLGFGWWNPATWVKTTADSGPLWSWWETMTGGTGLPALGHKWDDYRIVKLKPGTGYHGAATTERIIILEKGKSQLRHRFANAFLEPRPKVRPEGATLKSASPKPIRIAEVVTRAMADPGAVICDPFVGSGTHAVGIERAGCHALVNDVNIACFRDHLPAYGVPFVERKF